MNKKQKKQKTQLTPAEIFLRNITSFMSEYIENTNSNTFQKNAKRASRKTHFVR